MKSRSLFFIPLPLFLAPLMLAQSGTSQTEPPPPVTQGAPLAQMGNSRPNQALITTEADQRLYVPARTSLVAPEAAQALVEKFRATYAGPAAPRLVVYVNRELVDTSSGLQLTSHTEHYEETATGAKGEATATTTHTTGTNSYAVKTSAKPALADQQTFRDVERLFGRVFRAGGAKLADQKNATALLADKGGRLVGDPAAKDREALAQVADIAIEVLISSRNLTVPEVTGDNTYAVPDIQVTAIRLSDSAIVGQAAGSDVLGKAHQAAQIVRQFDVRDITEAVALALMEDMLTGAKP